MEALNIVESWEDHHNDRYAIIQHSEKEKRDYRIREYEAMYLLDGELNSFGGSVGYGIADYDTIAEAQEFLLRGIHERDINPEIWLQIVGVR